MSEWEQRITEHPVWQEMHALGPEIDAALQIEGVDGASAGIERIRTVLAFVGKRLAGADPATVLPAPLDSIAGGISASRNELTSYITDPDITHIRNANVHADAALSGLIQVSAPSSVEEFGALISALRSYRATLEEGLGSAKRTVERTLVEIETVTAKLSELETQIQSTQERQTQFAAEQEQAIRAKLTELAAAIQVEQQRMTEVIGDCQRQFVDAQEKRAQESSETIRAAQQQFTQVTSEQQGQFSSGQDSRSRDFADNQTARQAKFDGIITEYTQRLADQNADFTVQRESIARAFQDDAKLLTVEYAKKAQTILALVESHKANVEKLVGVIGNLGVTSGYQKTANQSRTAMWIWQVVTVCAIAGLITFAWYTLPLVEDKSGTFHWGIFAGRIFLTFACGVLAAYAGSQADKLFALETRNRKVALELEAIGPYLTLLPEDEQNKFRILIGERFFGRDEASPGRGVEKSPATLVDVLGSKEGLQILQLVGEIVQKERSKK